MVAPPRPRLAIASSNVPLVSAASCCSPAPHALPQAKLVASSRSRPPPVAGKGVLIPFPCRCSFHAGVPFLREREGVSWREKLRMEEEREWNSASGRNLRGTDIGAYTRRVLEIDCADKNFRSTVELVSTDPTTTRTRALLSPNIVVG